MFIARGKVIAGLVGLLLLAGCNTADPVGCVALTAASLPFAMFGSEPGNFESCSTPGHPLPE